jgi:hypothetical protein
VFASNPLIDTDLPINFTVIGFKKIKNGMHKTEVLNVIPPPLHSINGNTWIYGIDSNSVVGNYAGFQFWIKFNKNGQVIVTGKQMFRNRFYIRGLCPKSIRIQVYNRSKL